ncbi:MAG TPA: hypothetical protein VFV89_21830 [Nocardioides sp.]|uniref:hypothetical protein n=1 Tax=Nocardioides sp. TaxID=35761 RepID=UPI002E313CA7|nr:hypothetical protein [Nocardioides sp.]HEX5090465.1 hypothetical protein [Nocardioides sp.]
MTTNAARRRIPVVVVVTTLLVVVAGTAFAFWTALGSGSGAATTDGTEALILSPATPTAGLYPGGQAAVTTTVDNPNDAVVRIGSLALDPSQGTGGFAVDAAHSGCAVSTLGFTIQTNAGAGWTVPAHGSLPLTLPGAVSMSPSAANACQGARFTVYLKVAS